MASIAMTAIFMMNPAAVAQGYHLSPARQIEQQALSMTGIVADQQRRWDDCRHQLLRLRSIGEDWDGDGADAPSPDVIDSIVALIQSESGRAMLQTPPDAVNALRDGTIALEWYAPGPAHVIMRFDDPFKVQVMLISPDRPTSSFWQDFSNLA